MHVLTRTAPAAKKAATASAEMMEGLCVRETAVVFELVPESTVSLGGSARGQSTKVLQYYFLKEKNRIMDYGQNAFL